MNFARMPLDGAGTSSRTTRKLRSDCLRTTSRKSAAPLWVILAGMSAASLNQWTYSYKDVATKIIGRHTIKFGGDATRLFYLNECVACGVPSYSFFNPGTSLTMPRNRSYTTFDPHPACRRRSSGRPREHLGLLCPGRLESPPEPDPQPWPALVLLWPALLQRRTTCCRDTRAAGGLPDRLDRYTREIPGTRRKITSARNRLCLESGPHSTAAWCSAAVTA